jgi:hypothetical protein
MCVFSLLLDDLATCKVGETPLIKVSIRILALHA